MRTFVIGDIHGGYKALLQVLERSNFDYDNDKLICLGDVTDGWPDVAESIEELMKIKNLVYCLGNHDEWAIDGLENDMNSRSYLAWFTQGGEATGNSYKKNPHLLEKHLKFLKEAKRYYLDEENRLFLHAGINLENDVEDQPEATYIWDRRMIGNVSRGFTEGTEKYKEIYVGHTPTLGMQEIPEWVHGKPMQFGNVWDMDTGATYMGKLSMMEINTKELFQSDVVFTLYPDHKGRNGEKLADDPNWNKWGLFPDEPEHQPQKYKEDE